jgi:hypothetical protein
MRLVQGAPRRIPQEVYKAPLSKRRQWTGAARRSMYQPVGTENWNE